ncbi:MAG TPA: glycoside hydrolase family 32 protein [Chthonomonadaceae bacterium]|nr:glycoside hydrolase family 32 protein [Chthonomonadaceae bacterium]
MSGLFYKPQDAWAADFIPFYTAGRFWLFYLLDWRDREKHGEGTPWYLVSTADFVHFTEHGEVLPRGTVQDQDLYVFTGCVVDGEDGYHLFYTGHNPHFKALGKPVQAVMHAVSEDLLTWTKIPEDTFYAPPGYEPDDWRDPFVFWNFEAKEWWMLLAARFTEGPSRRRGCTALCASKDLKTWEVREPFYAPGLFYTHECPDLFRMGDWWYLVFSEFSERHVTRYRMSRTLAGPWYYPSGFEDTFDGRAWYAAKTASNGERRYAFGWNATREGERDYRPWQWGGNLAVHEILLAQDASLAVTLPETLDVAFNTQVPFEFEPGLGMLLDGQKTATVGATSTFGCAVGGPMPNPCKIEATITFDIYTRGCGLMLRSSNDYETGYYIRLEPHRNRLVFDSWRRPVDIGHMAELERPLALTPGQPVTLTVLIEDTVCEVYAGGRVALSARLYDHPTGKWGIFATEGVAGFHDVKLYTRT